MNGMDYSRFDDLVSKVKVGTTIVANAWGKFEEKTMKCIGMEYDARYQDDRFVFDNGVKWTKSNLRSNFALWESRNGFHVTEG